MWCKIIVLVKTRKYDNTPVLKTLNRTASILTLARVVMDKKFSLCPHITSSFCELSFHAVKIHILNQPTKDLGLIFRFTALFSTNARLRFSICYFEFPNWHSQLRTPFMKTTSDNISALPPGETLR